MTKGLRAEGRYRGSVSLLGIGERTLYNPRTLRLVPIAPEVAVAALPESFHRDPADRLIVATCRALNAPLVTRDRRRIARARLVKQWRPGVSA